MKLNEPLTALSWKQPFASLMLPPYNKIETRTWSTGYRGLMMICASKIGYSPATVDQICGNQSKRVEEFLIKHKIEVNAVLGKAIAIARLVNCRPMKKEDEEKAFVQYWPDLFCFEFAEVQPIVPIDWKGTQGYKRVDSEFLEKIQLL